MSASCRNAIDSSRENPFSLKHLYLCYSIEELEDIMEQKPVVVFATSKHINNSFAEDVFVKFASNEKNLILFTNKSLDPGTLGSQVLKLYSSSGGKVSFTKKSKIPLEGLELKNYLEQKRLEANSLQKEDISYSESESEEETQEAEEEKGAAQIFKKRARLASSYPMFVSKESHIITDDYGEVLKVEEFFINSGQQQKMLEDLDSKMSGTDDESDEDMTEPELPTKDIEELVTIDVLCSVHFIAFEGRLDGTSIRNILQNLSTRKMIIVKGDSESKRILQSFAEANVCKHVSVPKNNSTLSITSESAFKLKIRDSLDKHLRFSRIRDSYEIAWLDGVLEWESGFGIPTLRKTEDNEYEGHTSVFLGDVKLSDVQQKLITEANIEAEFVSGILVCGEEGTLNIRRKPNENVIQIRGGLSEDYFSVRNSIYNQYHIV
jgi:cleavage and polyadenylation specificity factor subunit 2